MTTNDWPGEAGASADVEIHPLAAVFPLLEGREFAELVEDVKQNGLRTPILLDAAGRVLDGRNRLRACRAAGVEPRFETWTGPGTAAQMIVSLNLRRRHLNESQRAMLAARMAEESRKLLKGKRLSDESANWQTRTTVEEAAALLNVSPRSVGRAVRLLAVGDASAIRAVETGRVSVSAAAEPAGRRPSRRRREKVSPEEAFRMLWEPARRLAEAVRQIEGRGSGAEARPGSR